MFDASTMVLTVRVIKPKAMRVNGTASRVDMDDWPDALQALHTLPLL
jgi:hypothetical protein